MTEDGTPEEDAPYFRVKLRSSKEVIDISVDEMERIEVTDSGLFILAAKGETNIYSPYAWEVIETNLDV